MTAALASGSLAELPTTDLTGWTLWLQNKIDRLWRPGEWDQAAWFFNGDLNNPRTGAGKCTTASCWTILPSPYSFCRHCLTVLAGSDMSREEFATSYQRPTRVRTPWGQERDKCMVERDGIRCGRPSYSLDLCRTHYFNWRRRPEASTDIAHWVETAKILPLTGKPTCIVRGCPKQRAIRGLCMPHQQLWTRQKRQGLTTADADAWAQQTAPFQLSHQFSFSTLAEPLRWEVLFGLQQRDARGGVIEPSAVRHLVRVLADRSSLLTGDSTGLEAEVRKKGHNATAHFREIMRAVRLGSLEFRGVAPTDADVWDLSAVGLRSQTRSGQREHAGTADMTAIRQTWLRDTLREWVRTTKPHSNDFGRTFRACVVASDALHARPGGGHDPAALRFADMQAVFTAMCALRREDGELAGRIWRKHMFGCFVAILDFGRTADLLNDMSASFGRHQSMVIPHDATSEDDPGKAIPEPVIAQLDSQLAVIGAGYPYGELAAEDVHLMLRTVYVVLRDTGRRPVEVASLRLNCLETSGAETDLIWDNHKKRRYGRRLPIAGQTAEAIRSWQARRGDIPAPATSSDYLFPAMTARSGTRHLQPGGLANALREWVAAIPALLSDQLDESGNRLPFDRSLIFPYAFRHSYAQRHADAGVPVDVLKELMDHRQIATTMSYYQVSQKRKREAVKTMRLHTVDRSGRPAPFSSTTAYEARSVAVPFGNCTEPSNVKAGGKSCPLRFQCAGCGFYRPDPSYLPAIEEHLNSLRADRETATAMDADVFVTRNLTDQINAYTDVVSRMNDQLDQMPADERLEVEQASAALRKIRATSNHKLLPLTVVRHGETRDAR
ncbi:tyrosine-type recombinase/integrase [Kitasatospora sp. NPDC056531]|uniref:tyrosine-type recombinase/integrase n=1 Tax=Kitasatospora sp. NPDC056531 TaxID=3345856 RepID=UPI0036C41AA6